MWSYKGCYEVNALGGYLYPANFYADYYSQTPAAVCGQICLENQPSSNFIAIRYAFSGSTFPLLECRCATNLLRPQDPVMDPESRCGACPSPQPGLCGNMVSAVAVYGRTLRTANIE